VTWNGAILYFRGPFADRDGLRNLTAPVFKDMRVLRSAYAALTTSPTGRTGPSGSVWAFQSLHCYTTMLLQQG
jgi:hypothetical protein